MNKTSTILLFILLSAGSAFAQSVKFSGYIQSQYQYGEKDASLKVGTGNENSEESFHRIGIRRGRFKLTATDGSGLASGIFQLDVTEKGVGFKDAYLNVKDPWVNTLQLRAGIFDRPFGNEISYSSSRRESPERSTLFQTLFPDERDLGAMLILQPAKGSAWNVLKLEAGLFAGNGIKQETDSRKDFIGHLSLAKTVGNAFSYGLGVSYYNGGVFQGTQNVYSMDGAAFAIDSAKTNKGKFAKREYVGFDAQLTIASALGFTQLRAEYLTGQQPGLSSSSKSPNASALPTGDTYIRNFSGAYAIFIQDLGALPFSAVLKYDFYDPNTKVSGDEIGSSVSAGSKTSKADLTSSTFGFGLLWKISNATRLQAFYEVIANETSTHVSGYAEDRKDNVFTLRLQYKF
ncbi:MAG: OprO/OprP family phosphate-selective porin [Dysgonamonadaceae bacterium]|jgi:phosphate-selective porin|nr:OprO/OprP family phosphate-selective porin [Dysgonamonadaceae bacterium]